MTLACERPDSVEGTMSWTVNDQPISINDKYNISSSPDGSTLIVKEINKNDRGESHIFLSSYILTVLGQD